MTLICILASQVFCISHSSRRLCNLNFFSEKERDRGRDAKRDREKKREGGIRVRFCYAWVFVSPRSLPVSYWTLLHELGSFIHTLTRFVAFTHYCQAKLILWRTFYLDATKKIEANKYIIESIYPLLKCPKGTCLLNCLVIARQQYSVYIEACCEWIHSVSSEGGLQEGWFTLRAGNTQSLLTHLLFLLNGHCLALSTKMPWEPMSP